MLLSSYKRLNIFIKIQESKESLEKYKMFLDSKNPLNHFMIKSIYNSFKNFKLLCIHCGK